MSHKKMSEYLDPRTIIFLLMAVSAIYSGWFGQRERISAIEFRIQYNEKVISDQRMYLKEMRENVTALTHSVAQIEAMLRMVIPKSSTH